MLSCACLTLFTWFTFSYLLHLKGSWDIESNSNNDEHNNNKNTLFSIRGWALPLNFSFNYDEIEIVDLVLT